MSTTSSSPAASSRSVWVDNLRTLVILLVVNMHACVTYSHVGDWYVMESPEPGMSVKVPFIFWQGHLQAFFMGLLFFLAGVFSYRSLERRGPGAFLRERLVRLGLPALLYMLVIHPFMVYVLLGHPHIPDRPSLPVLYGRYLTSERVLSGSGPLWFALALLVFSAALAGCRDLMKPRVRDAQTPVVAPSVAGLLSFAFAIIVGSFLVRLVQPIGTNFLNFQLCFFSQYLAAFIAGVAAGRNGWLTSLANSRRARVAGWMALIGGPLLLTAVIVLGGAPPEKGHSQYDGGWQAAALGLAIWEQLAGLGLSLGLLAVFQFFFNTPNRVAAWLSDRAFGVYVLHAPVLVALTLALHPLGTNPFLRMLLLTVTGLICSFLAADLAKRIPGLRKIL